MSGGGAVESIAMAIAGRPPAWRDVQATAEEVLASSVQHGLHGLLRDALRASAPDWPVSIRERLDLEARGEAAIELLRAREVSAALADLRDAQVEPIVFKGTALAYTIYRSPDQRPRNDTDVLVPSDRVAVAKAVLAARGYRETATCSGLFSQFEARKTDAFGLLHALDVHWAISTQPVFAGVLSHTELTAEAQPAPGLGPGARVPSRLHALLLACMHPVMHHRNDVHALWVHDIHLLASRCSTAELDRLIALARDKKVAAICAHQLDRARTLFGTRVPSEVLNALDVSGEPSRGYLAPHRWHHELLFSIRSLPGVRRRWRHLREVFFPDPVYMFGAYGVEGSRFRGALLPALYIHRNLRGVWKILAGTK